MASKHIEELPDKIRPIIRVGIAMGEVIIADDTVTGEGIILAQRLEQLAGPGERIIAIGGSGHMAILKQLLEIDRRLESASVVTYF